MFSFQRRVIVEGSASEVTETITAIVAGSVFSRAVLRMVLIWHCDRLLSLFPQVSLAKYVDDVSLRMRGARRAMVELVPEVVGSFIGSMEALDFEV